MRRGPVIQVLFLGQQLDEKEIVDDRFIQRKGKTADPTFEPLIGRVESGMERNGDGGGVQVFRQKKSWLQFDHVPLSLVDRCIDASIFILEIECALTKDYLARSLFYPDSFFFFFIIARNFAILFSQ